MTWVPYTAFILGLAGSLHCIGMCGPLVMSLPFRKEQGTLSASRFFFYHIGKLTTYSAFGAVAGLLGSSFAFFHWQQALSFIAGGALLLLTLLPFLKRKLSFGTTVSTLYARLHQRATQLPSSVYLFLSGLLNGLLPCGLVYAALAGAAATGHLYSAILFMFFFGLGTMPSLSSVIFLQHKMQWKYRSLLSKSSMYLSLAVALLLLLRGMNLGIPYVSPHINDTATEMSCCHRR